MYFKRLLFSLALFLHTCNALVVNFGFFVDSPDGESKDYVELGRFLTIDKKVAIDLKDTIHDLILDFLLSESRVLVVENVYRIGAKVANVHHISQNVIQYKLVGEIADLQSYLVRMLTALQRAQEEPKWFLKGIYPQPQLYSRTLQAFCLDSQIYLSYHDAVMDLDGYLVVRLFTESAQKPVVNDEGYALLISQKSDESTLKPKKICENCNIS